MSDKLNKLNVVDENNMFKFELEKRVVKIDGIEIRKVRSIEIKHDTEEHYLPTIKLEFDSNVKIEGNLMAKKIAPIHCEKCGRLLGYFVGSYEVVCPNCEELNYDFLLG